MSRVRVLLVAEVEVADPGFASDYVLEAAARLNLAGVAAVRGVAPARHPELRRHFLPQITRDPLTRPDGRPLPLYYPVGEAGPGPAAAPDAVDEMRAFIRGERADPPS